MNAQKHSEMKIYWEKKVKVTTHKNQIYFLLLLMQLTAVDINFLQFACIYNQYTVEWSYTTSHAVLLYSWESMIVLPSSSTTRWFWLVISNTNIRLLHHITTSH